MVKSHLYHVYEMYVWNNSTLYILETYVWLWYNERQNQMLAYGMIFSHRINDKNIINENCKKKNSWIHLYTWKAVGSLFEVSTFCTCFRAIFQKYFPIVAYMLQLKHSMLTIILRIWKSMPKLAKSLKFMEKWHTRFVPVIQINKKDV